jgi:hypothetical protein
LILPDQELRPEGAADANLVGAVRGEDLRAGVVDEAQDLHVRKVLGEFGGAGFENDRQDTGADLASGLGDELFRPVREPDNVGAVRDECQLVAARLRCRDCGAEDEPRVLGAVHGEGEGDGLCLVEEFSDVDAGESGGDEPECGQNGETPPDRWVGVEDAVAGGASGRVERGTGIGDDNDAAYGVDAGLAEGALEHAALAVGLRG